MAFQYPSKYLSRISCRGIIAVGLFALGVCAFAQSAPSGIWAQAKSASNVISWNSVPGATSYNVYRGTTAGGESSAPYQNVFSANLTDSGVSSGNNYYYKVTALYGKLEGSRSSEVSCKTGSTLAGTTIPVAVAGSNSVSLRFSAVPSATLYRIFRYNNFYGFQQTGTTTGQSFTDNTAMDGVEYYYYVVPANAATDGSQSIQISAVPGDGALGIPPVTMTIPTSTANNVQWDPVPGANNYVVYRSTQKGQEGTQPYAIVQGSGFTDNSVTAGQTYYYTIAAIDYSGAGSAGPETSATPGSSALQGGLVAAVANAKSVTLTWQAIAGATSYYVVRGDGSFWNNQTLVAHVTSGVSYTDSAVSVNGTYVYCIYPASVNGATSNTNNSATAKVGDNILSAPTGLYAVSQKADVQLYWNPVPGAYGYAIYRSTSGTPTLYTIAYYTTGFTDNSVSAGTTYTYSISALDAASESKASSTVTGEMNEAQLPGPLATAVVSGSNITVYWSLISGAVSYDVFRQVSGEPMLAIATGFKPGSGSTIGAFSDTTAPAETDCVYYVCAVNSTGIGSSSNQVSAGTGDPLPPTPSATYAYSSTPSGGASVIDVYVNPVPGVVNYNVYRATSSGKEGSLPYAVNIGAGFTDPNVKSGVVYYYTFTSVDSDGQSGFSPECSAATGGTPLPAPLATCYVKATEIDLDWSAIPNATSYNVFRAIGNGQYTLYQQNVASTSLADTDVSASQPVSYRVAAVNSSGTGLMSATVTGRLGSSAPGVTTGDFAYPISTGSVITWNYVPGALSYNIFRSTTSGGEGLVPLASATGNQGLVNFTDTTGAVGTTYYYTVTAVTADNQGASSVEVSVKPESSQLAAPTLAATYATGKVTLSWNAITGAKGYDLFRSDPVEGIILFQQNLSGVSYTDTAVIHGINYSYFIVAVQSSGAGNSSNTVNGTP